MNSDMHSNINAHTFTDKNGLLRQEHCVSTPPYLLGFLMLLLHCQKEARPNRSCSPSNLSQFLIGVCALLWPNLPNFTNRKCNVLEVYYNTKEFCNIYYQPILIWAKHFKWVGQPNNGC